MDGASKPSNSWEHLAPFYPLRPREKFMLSQEEDQLEGQARERGLDLGLEASRPLVMGFNRQAGRVPHLTWPRAQATRLPIEDVHSPLLFQRGSHSHVCQRISIDVCQGGNGSSKLPKGVARIPLQF